MIKKGLRHVKLREGESDDKPRRCLQRDPAVDPVRVARLPPRVLLANLQQEGVISAVPSKAVRVFCATGVRCVLSAANLCDLA